MALPGVFQFPATAELSEIASERARVIDAESALSRVLPIQTSDGWLVEWEYRENITGMPPVLFADQQFVATKGTGSKAFGMQPYRFGEQRTMSEKELLNARRLGGYDHEALGDWMDRNMSEMLIRQHNAMTSMRSQILGANAYVTMYDGEGHSVTTGRWDRPTDAYIALSGGDKWDQASTGLVLGSLRQCRELRWGSGFAFDRRSLAIANTVTWSKAYSNTNSADLGGKRGNYGQTLTDDKGIVEYISNNENLPTPVWDDSTWLSDDGTVNKAIPDGYVYLVGYHMTNGLRGGSVQVKSHIGLNGRAGVYANAGNTHTEPPRPYLALGANFGPRIDYLKQFLCLKVY